LLWAVAKTLRWFIFIFALQLFPSGKVQKKISNRTGISVPDFPRSHRKDLSELDVGCWIGEALIAPHISSAVLSHAVCCTHPGWAEPGNLCMVTLFLLYKHKFLACAKQLPGLVLWPELLQALDFIEHFLSEQL